MPKISVLMPIYNTPAEYIREAIDSILAQSFQDFELLAIDDGSTDKNVAKTVKSYKDKRVKYLYKKNGDIGDALNFGLDHARGEFIARMDSDDISLPNRFQKQIDFLENNPDVSIVGGWIHRFGDSDVIGKYPADVRYLDMMYGCMLAHPTVMWRRADFEKYGLRYDMTASPAEDYKLWSRVISMLKIANIQEVLLMYRWHGNNASVARSEKQQKVTRDVQNNMLELLTADKKMQKIIKDNYKPEYKITKFDIPLFKIKKNEDQTKFYIFGVQLFRIKRRKK